MFYNKSDYALNKKDSKAIVYSTADGSIIRLTQDDFVNEEAFLFWKTLSDADYHRCDLADHIHSIHTLSLENLYEGTLTVPGADEQMEAEYDHKKQMQMTEKLVSEIKSCISDAQYRRLKMYHIDSLTVREIAQKEAISFQCVHKSIMAAEKKIFKFLKK